MGLLAKYDAHADRIRLALQSEGEAPWLFWVTRRQWLAWLHALTKISAQSALIPDMAHPAPRHRKRQSIPEGGEPLVLKRISIRSGPGVIKMLFALETRVLSIELPTASTAQLLSMLQQQAEIAGWDYPAALVRLGAASDASEAISNARKMH